MLRKWFGGQGSDGGGGGSFEATLKQLRGHLVTVNGKLNGSGWDNEEEELCAALDAQLKALCEFIEAEAKQLREAKQLATVGDHMQELLSSPLLQQIESVCLTRASTKLRRVFIRFLLCLLTAAASHVFIMHEAPLKVINNTLRFCTQPAQNTTAGPQQSEKEGGPGQHRNVPSTQTPTASPAATAGNDDSDTATVDGSEEDPLAMPDPVLPEAEAKLLCKLVGRVMAYVKHDASLLNLLFVNTQPPSFHVFDATLLLLEQPGKLRTEIFTVVTTICRLSRQHRDLQRYIASSRLVTALSGRVARSLAAMPSALPLRRRAWMVPDTTLNIAAPGAVTYINTLRLCTSVLGCMPAVLQNKLCRSIQRRVVETVMLPRLVAPHHHHHHQQHHHQHQQHQQQQQQQRVADGAGLRDRASTTTTTTTAPPPQRSPHRQLVHPRGNAARACAAMTAYVDMTLRHVECSRLTHLVAHALLGQSHAGTRVWTVLCRRMAPPRSYSGDDDGNDDDGNDDDDDDDDDLGGAEARKSDGDAQRFRTNDEGGSEDCERSATTTAASQLRHTTLALMDTLLQLQLPCVYERAALAHLRRQRKYYDHGAIQSRHDASHMGAPPSIADLSTSTVLSCPLQQVFLLGAATEMQAATFLLALRIVGRGQSPDQQPFAQYLHSARGSMAEARRWWTQPGCRLDGGGDGCYSDSNSGTRDDAADGGGGCGGGGDDEGHDAEADAAFLTAMLQCIHDFLNGSLSATFLITGLVCQLAALDSDEIRTFMFEPETEQAFFAHVEAARRSHCTLTPPSPVTSGTRSPPDPFPFSSQPPTATNPTATTATASSSAPSSSAPSSSSLSATAVPRR